jgi:hypothetical protein
MNSGPAPRSQAVRLLQAIETQAERLAHWLERHPMWPIGGILVLCLVCACVLASRKLMWNDELYTYYIATQPTVRQIWQALMTGAEQIPPTFHLLTRGVPSPSYGLIAMVFPLVTDAYRYAYEARPYALLLGLSGLALVSWQAASEGRNRWPWLMLLGGSLAGAVASHYYGVLVVAALAIAELVRTRLRGPLDPPVWIALVLACTAPLLPRHEVAAAVAFVLIPVLAFVLGVLMTNTFLFRYAPPAVLGLASLAAFGVYSLPRARAGRDDAARGFGRLVRAGAVR